MSSTLIINASFTAVIATLAYIDYASYGTHKHKDFKSAILSIGILGTFFGIFWGLQEFDTKNIQESVPHLLGGLKVAFFTSIVGMGFAILLMVAQRFSGKKSDSEQSFDFIFTQAQKLDNLDVLHHLEQLNKLDTLKHLITLEMNAKEQLHRFDAILENQNRFQKELENVISEKFDQTNQALEKAIVELARGASGELIKALEHVISDFNSQLQAQFGDNFKELNSAVDRLLVWQENYASYIEKAEKSLSHSIAIIEKSGDAFEKIAARNSEVMETYEKLRMVLEASNHQIKTLNAQLEWHGRLGEKAIGTFEAIDSGFLELKSSFNDLKEEIALASSESKDAYIGLKNEIALSISGVMDEIRGFNTQVARENSQMMESTRENLSSFVYSQTDLVKEALEELNNKAMLSLTALDAHNRGFTQALSERTKEVLDNILISNKAVLEELTESHNRYGEILKESAQKSSNELAKIFEETNKKVVDEIGVILASLTQATNESMREISKSVMLAFTESASEIATKNMELTKVVLGNMEESKGAFIDMKSTIIANANEAKESLVESLSLVKSQFEAMKDEALKKDAIILESFQKSGYEISMLAKKITESFEISASSVKSLAKKSEDAIKDGFDEMKLSVTQQHSLLKEALTKNIDAIREKIEAGSIEISSMLKSSLLAYENELTGFRKAFFESVGTLFREARDEMKESASDLITHSRELSENHALFLQELSAKSLELPKGLAANFEESFAKLNKELRAYALNTHASIKDAKSILVSVTKELKESTEQNISQNRELSRSLRDSLSSLDSALSHLTVQFKSDYEWFLRRIRELIGATNR